MKIRNILNLVFLAALCLSLVALTTGCSGKRKASQSSDIAGTGLSESDLDMQREGRFAGGSVPYAEGEGLFRDVHFGFDSSTIDDIGRQNIDYNFQILKENPTVKVQLEGHCDERGTVEYNLALGSKRGRAVYDLLISYGIPASQIDTISYGEEMPLETASNEMAWAKNRRVHFSGYSKKQ